MGTELSNRSNASLQTPGVAFSQKKLIGDLYTCETAKYILEKRIKDIEKRILAADNLKSFSVVNFNNSSFGKKYNKAYVQQKQYPTAPEKKNFDIETTFFVLFIPFGIVGIIAAAIKFFKLLLKVSFGQMLKEMFLALVICLAIPTVLLIIAALFTKIKNAVAESNYEATCAKIDAENKAISEKNAAARKQYENEYDAWVKEERKKYDQYAHNQRQQIQQIQAALRTEKQQAQAQLNKVNATLAELYSLRIDGVLCFHPNYKGLVPVSIIYGYFDTRRCSVFEGHEGAYNLYEDEKIKGIIINQLSTVMQKLNDLNGTMYYVGQAVNRCEDQLRTLNFNMERSLDRISELGTTMQTSMQDMSNNIAGTIKSSAARIEENTANTAYYSKIGADMATFNAFYSVYRDL
ncbi:MAG: hypothetical protein IKB13_06805 [Clostridia bacterium]|nr:hypothetical protein [Clostridia bacterium]